MGQTLVPNQVRDRSRSTNDDARALAEGGAPHGSWVSARIQESGRGRLGRRWESIEGNLFLSIVCRIEDKSLWSWVPLATAAGVLRVLGTRFPSVELTIKWPNDLWIGRGAAGAKLGGILCEAVGMRENSFIIIGVGLNCVASPEGLDQAASSLSSVAGRVVNADEIRESVIEGILVILRELESSGPAAVIVEYERRAALPAGTPIEWAAGRGTVEGLGPSGELRVTGEDGRTVSLYAEDVSPKLRRG